MPQPSSRAARAAVLATLALSTAHLAGCYTASGDRLGRYPVAPMQDGLSVGDALGAAIFQEHVRLIAMETRRGRNGSEFATAGFGVD